MNRNKKDTSARISARVSQKCKNHLVKLANVKGKTETDVLEEIILKQKVPTLVGISVGPKN